MKRDGYLEEIDRQMTTDDGMARMGPLGLPRH